MTRRGFFVRIVAALAAFGVGRKTAGAAPTTAGAVVTWQGAAAHAEVSIAPGHGGSAPSTGATYRWRARSWGDRRWGEWSDWQPFAGEAGDGA